MKDSPSSAVSRGISVVIPHRDSPFLVEAVSSVAEQRLRRPYEIIIVDDCSQSVESMQVLSALAAREHVHVVRNASHQGVQTVRNQGVACARFDYILPLDADDMLRVPQPGRASFLARATRVLDTDDSACFVHTGSWMIGGATGPTIGSYPMTPDRVVRKSHVPINILFRKADLAAGITYDESVSKWQDWSFAVELLASRWRRGLASRISFIGGNHHLYRIHDRGKRVSSAVVDEYEMTLLTVQRNYDYFSHCYGFTGPAEELARIVVDAKPSKLTDLMHMARFDIVQAQALIMSRDATLVTAFDALGVP